MKKNQGSFKFKLSEFILVILIFSSGTLLAFKSGRFVLNFKEIGFSVVSTAEKGVHAVWGGITGTFTSAKQLRTLKKDYNDLVLKLENYEQMQRTNVDIRKENERLKEQLGFSQSLEEKNIPSQIISRDLDNLYSYITINKGAHHGVKKNMPVVAYQNGTQGLVGKVVEVGLVTSQVMPIYNLECSVSARVQNTRNIGLVSGQGDPDFYLNMEYIKKRVKDELHIGDIVVTSGENNNYMRDIPIGTIAEITDINYNSSLNIKLQTIIDFSRLETVFVVNQKELNDKKENIDG